MNPAAAPSSVSSALSPGDAGGCSSRYLTGSVDGGVGSIVRRHLDHAGVRLHALSKDGSVNLRCYVALATVAGPPRAMIRLNGNDGGWVLMDSLSGGEDADSVVGGNTPGDRDLLRRSGLLVVVDGGSRIIPYLHRPGLGDHRWWHSLLLLSLLLLSLMGHSKRVTLRRVPLVLRSAGLRKWVGRWPIGND